MLEALLQLLGSYGQSHVLDHWDKLNAEERESLAAQIRNIDLELLQRLFLDQDQSSDWEAIASKAVSPPAFRLIGENRFSADYAAKVGEDAIRAGRLGVVLVAGGQGSRLGFDHPKGMYPIGPVSNRTLFQMHIEQLRAVADTYGVSLPLYLMTSPATHDETVSFFEQHKLFGLDPSDLKIFCQGTIPALDAETGRLLLASPSEIFQSPDGHGGTLAALQRNGLLDDMQSRGISELYYFQVDNPLVEICQRDLVGYHLLSESELTTQVVAKKDPLEKVGNVVLVDGKMMVIEYSDLPNHLAPRVNVDGRPVFWAGSIAVHLFSVDFLRRCAFEPGGLPVHRAYKQVPFVDGAGDRVEPKTPNAIKFERFIFDLLPAAKNPIVVEGASSDVFAPLKNASGAPKDTPESTRAAIVAKHTRLLAEAGVDVAEGVQVEISPLFALDLVQLRARIEPGTVCNQDHYFQP